MMERPLGGLLGGAPEDPPKKSKLAALAAARRKKENDKAIAASATSSVALLDKLGSPQGETGTTPREKRSLRVVKELKQPTTKPKDLHPPETSTSTPQKVTNDVVPSTPGLTFATPSAFAQTLTGNSLTSSDNPTSFDVQTTKLTFAENAFSGPSPDDIVANAQSASKGLKSRQKANAKQSVDAKSHGKKTKDITTGVAEVAINDPPRPKSPKAENVDVAAEYAKSQGKRTANFVVIGTLHTALY